MQRVDPSGGPCSPERRGVFRPGDLVIVEAVRPGRVVIRKAMGPEEPAERIKSIGLPGLGVGPHRHG